MGTADPARAIASVANALEESLGDRLFGLILFGSFAAGHYNPDTSDINLLAVLTGAASLHQVRDAFLPLWQRHKCILKRAPIIVQHDRLPGYLHLHPSLAHHLAQYGRTVAGEKDLLSRLNWHASPDPNEATAALAMELMQLSALLVASLLNSKRQGELEERLARLSKRFFHGEARPEAAISEQLIALQETIYLEIAGELEATIHEPPRTEAPPLLPNLEAVYEYRADAILVLPEPLAAQIQIIDWSAVGERLAGQYEGMMITSPQQLHFIARYANPVEVAIGSYVHAWGDDLLADLIPSRKRILLASARRASKLRTADLPNAYLTADDSLVGDLIHEFQNKLLNIQLQHELLALRLGIPLQRPPDLPGRSASLRERIDAIAAQLDWWIDFDLSLLG